MRIAILGLWHLGSVTAACSAEAGHSVIAFDPNPETVAQLSGNRPPVAEPGLAELIARNTTAGRLRFTTSLDEAVRDAEIVWVCYDTPVNEDDTADVDVVVRHVEAAFPFLSDGAVLLSSSQLPVGTLRAIQAAFAAVANGRRVSFACSPENLRLGKAIEVFRHPDRVVLGVRDDDARERLAALFAPITDRLEWMSVESAEMTKHAINAFLATSVTFINELASLCERTGADAREVERGLKTERRIGADAYLAPGGAIAGGTLARDISFLRSLGVSVERATPLLDGVVASNTSHRAWVQQRLTTEVGPLAGTRVAVWGLTYKAGTDTLRRSGAVELCRWLMNQRVEVHVHDPVVRTLPPELRSVVVHDHPVEAAAGAAALVVATNWPEYLSVDPDALSRAMPHGLVLDANRFLTRTLGKDARFRLVSVGQPSL